MAIRIMTVSSMQYSVDFNFILFAEFVESVIISSFLFQIVDFQILLQECKTFFSYFGYLNSFNNFSIYAGSSAFCSARKNDCT